MDTSIGHALRLHDSGTSDKYIGRYDVGLGWQIFDRPGRINIGRALTAETRFPKKVHIWGDDDVVGGTSHVGHPVTRRRRVIYYEPGAVHRLSTSAVQYLQLFTDVNHTSRRIKTFKAVAKFEVFLITCCNIQPLWRLRECWRTKGSAAPQIWEPNYYI